MSKWFLHDPARFEEPRNKTALVILSGLFGPMVAGMWMSAVDLQTFVTRERITSGQALYERALDKPGGAPLFANVTQASTVLQWMRMSSDPEGWAKQYTGKMGIAGQAGGATLLRNKPSMIYGALQKLNVARPDAPGPLGDPNHFIWLGVDILETFIFWVDELNLKSLQHAIIALNQSAPSIVDLIQETTSGLLSPLGVFPLSSIVFNALGQIAAYPFIATVTYLNISQRNWSGAMETSSMFLLFIGPFVNMVLRQSDRLLTVDPTSGRTPLAEIFNFPHEIAEQAEHLRNAGKRITDAMKSVFGVASSSARDAVSAAMQSEQVKGVMESDAVRTGLGALARGRDGATAALTRARNARK